MPRKKTFDFWSYVKGAVRGTKEILDMIKQEETPKCKHCASSEYVVKFGTCKGVQRWWCKKCQRKFSDTDTLPRMKTPIRQIASALSMYYGGMSLNAIRRHIDQQYGYRPSESTLYAWLTRFSKTAIERAKDYKPDVGNVWIADETVLKIGGKKYWFWDLIDSKSRFLLASHFSVARTIADVLTLMKKAEHRAGKVPEIILTDKLHVYTDGVELAWGADAKHLPSKGFVKPFNTNLIERFHGSLKDRTKVMRGLKKRETARLLMDGWLVHYNFFRTHEALGDRTPAEKAGVDFPFKNWLDVVRKPQKTVTTQKVSSPITRQPKIKITAPTPRITPPTPKLRR